MAEDSFWRRFGAALGGQQGLTRNALAYPWLKLNEALAPPVDSALNLGAMALEGRRRDPWAITQQARALSTGAEKPLVNFGSGVLSALRTGFDLEPRSAVAAPAAPGAVAADTSPLPFREQMEAFAGPDLSEAGAPSGALSQPATNIENEIPEPGTGFIRNNTTGQVIRLGATGVPAVTPISGYRPRTALGALAQTGGIVRQIANDRRNRTEDARLRVAELTAAENVAKARAMNEYLDPNTTPERRAQLLPLFIGGSVRDPGYEFLQDLTGKVRAFHKSSGQELGANQLKTPQDVQAAYRSGALTRQEAAVRLKAMGFE